MHEGIAEGNAQQRELDRKIEAAQDLSRVLLRKYGLADALEFVAQREQNRLNAEFLHEVEIALLEQAEVYGTLQKIRSFGPEGVEWQVLRSQEQKELSLLDRCGLVLQRGNRVYDARWKEACND